MKAEDKNNNLGFLLNSTTNALSKFMQRKLNEFEIDVPFEQIKLLMFISFNEGVNQQMICGQLNKAKPGISRLVNGLVEKGLVKQVRDKEDRRNNKLFVTPKGAEVRDTFFPLGSKALHDLEMELGEEESVQLKTHLLGIKNIILDKLNEE